MNRLYLFLPHLLLDRIMPAASSASLLAASPPLSASPSAEAASLLLQFQFPLLATIPPHRKRSRLLFPSYPRPRLRAGRAAGKLVTSSLAAQKTATRFEDPFGFRLTSGTSLFMESISGDSMQNDLVPKLAVVGHRGCGKNKTLAPGELPDSRPSISENTITSFNLAARNGADFVEFDVQVTKDGRPVVFHDDLLLTSNQTSRVTDLTLDEFLACGPETLSGRGGKSLLRKCHDGSIGAWKSTVEDGLCTLQEVFEQVDQVVGFNIEVKFADDMETPEAELHRTISAILLDVQNFSNGRRIYFSSFHPDAVAILRKQQHSYPVFFLTDGGGHIYKDNRRNSIQAAIDVCLKYGLQGIVSEVKPILRCPAAVSDVKQAGLFLFTYGEVNNLAEAVVRQSSLGVDGVIVDHVPEIVAVARYLYQITSLPGVDHAIVDAPMRVKAAA